MAGVSTGRAAALAVHFLVGCRDAPCGDYLPPLSITYSVEHDVYGYGDEDAPVEVHDRHQLVRSVGVVRTSAQELVKMVY